MLNTKYKIRNTALGFTLVELLLYMGIFIILLSVFIQLFSSLIATQLESQATGSVSEDSKYVVARLSYDISRSQNVISPSLGVASSSAKLIVNGTQYSYGMSSGNLILTNTDGNIQLNSADTSITTISFTPAGSSSGKFTILVTITLSSRTSNQGKRETQTIQTTLGNR